MKSLPHIPMPLECIDPQGRKWHPYGVEFDSPDGKFECVIYAVSDMHAELQLESLKENGRINGQTIGVYPEFKEPGEEE